MADGYNFVGSGDIPDNSLPAKAGFAERMFGGFLDQNYGVNRAIRHQTVEINRYKLLNAYTARAMQARALQGMSKIGEVLANGSFDDPATMQSVLSLSATYGVDPEVVDPLMKRFQSAMDYNQRAQLIQKEYDLRLEVAKEESRGRLETERLRQERLSDNSTASKKDLETARQYDGMAKALEAGGFPEEAASYRRDANLLRSRLEGGPSSYEGSLLRERDELELRKADYEAKLKQGKTFELRGGYPLYYKDELGGIQAQIDSINRKLRAYGIQEPQLAPDTSDPLNLFE